jgi:hypothetical protein
MPTEEETLAANKAVVARFNKEVIEQGNETTFRETHGTRLREPVGATGSAYGTVQREIRRSSID